MKIVKREPLDHGVVELIASETTGMMIGPSQVYWTYKTPEQRLFAYLLAQTHWKSHPRYIIPKMPDSLGFVVLYHRKTGLSAPVILPTFGGLSAALSSINPPRKQPADKQ